MTMTTLNVHAILNKRALVTRQSARPIGAALNELRGTGEIALDFSGVEAVTPSFIDELLTLLRTNLESADGVRLIVLNPPTRLSEKFAAVARAHDMTTQELTNGSWLVSSIPPDRQDADRREL